MAALSWLLILCGLAIPGTGAPPAAAQAQAVQVPPGFADIAVTEVYGTPTDLVWLGDDILESSQEGWIHRFDPAAPDVPPVLLLDLSAVIGKGPEQGLLGIVPDPDFASRPYIYVYYTRSRGTGHCDILPANCHNRLSRFTMGADGKFDPASELPLLNTIFLGSLHNAGDLVFGRDGLLYVSTGDAGAWENGQNLSNLNGKILRIDREGNPAPDNPFATDDSVSCRDSLPLASTQPCAEIFAYGLRNPFRIAFDPNIPVDRFFINDVGQTGWEEIDLGQAGANYGWPLLEGPCPPGFDTGCWEEQPFVAPIYVYSHLIGCFAVTGGAFVPDGSPWGARYHGKYLFADWGCGKIFVLEPGEDGRFSASLFARGMQTITPILFSLDGATLYYGREGGIIRAIVRDPAG
jgi:glucose/arabinose dehydrogenase